MACVRCHRTKCPLWKAFLLFLLTFSLSSIGIRNFAWGFKIQKKLDLGWQKISAGTMGLLAPGCAHTWHSTWPPIVTCGNYWWTFVLCLTYPKNKIWSGRGGGEDHPQGVNFLLVNKKCFELPVKSRREQKIRVWTLSISQVSPTASWMNPYICQNM